MYWSDSSHTARRREDEPPRHAARATADSRAGGSSASSAAFTAGCRARDRRDTSGRRTTAHTTPIAPKISKVRRQDIHPIRSATSERRERRRSSRVASHTTAWARSRSWAGSQVVRIRASCWESARLAGSEQGARHDQRRAAPDPARGRGEERPPQHDAHQHAARARCGRRASPPGSRTARRPSRRRTAPSPSAPATGPGPCGCRRRLRDGDAVDVGDQRQQHDEQSA